MDATRFDSLSREVGTSSRRQMIRLLGGGIAGTLAAAAGLGGASAKTHKKRQKHQNQRRRVGEPSGNARLLIPDDGPTEDSPPADDPTTVYLLPQQDFVSKCRANGGTPTRVSTHVVKCCNESFCDTCDFNYDPPQCKQTIKLENGAEVDGPVTPGPALPAPAESDGPVSPGPALPAP